jgi:hypothetical protein
VLAVWNTIVRSSSCSAMCNATACSLHINTLLSHQRVCFSVLIPYLLLPHTQIIRQYISIPHIVTTKPRSQQLSQTNSRRNTSSSLRSPKPRTNFHHRYTKIFQHHGQPPSPPPSRPATPRPKPPHRRLQRLRTSIRLQHRPTKILLVLVPLANSRIPSGQSARVLLSLLHGSNAR